MADITLDIAGFRTRFPAFANVATYPDAIIEAWFDAATCYISDCNYGALMDDCRRQAIELMMAHLMNSNDVIQSGQQPLVLNNARIHNVSVSIRPPTSANNWRWWLNTTPYGIRLQALLEVSSVGGFYIGGRRERAAFRKTFGGF